MSSTAPKRTDENKYERHYVLLQPSAQTLLADLNSITNDCHFIWTQEDKYALESQLLLATAPPLCLAPSPAVAIVRNRAHSQHSPMSDERDLRRFSVRYTEAYRLKATRWSHYTLPYPFRLLKFNNANIKRNSNHHANLPTIAKENTEFFNSLLNTQRSYSLDKRFQQELNEKSNGFQVNHHIFISQNSPIHLKRAYWKTKQKSRKPKQKRIEKLCGYLGFL
jgi:hypothetical protein